MQKLKASRNAKKSRPKINQKNKHIPVMKLALN